MTDVTQQRALKVEAGFGEIDTQEDLHKRLEVIQLPFVEMINVLIKEAEILLQKNMRTPQDEQRLQELNSQIFNMLLHKTNKVVATAFSVAGEDRDMSERYAALEEFYVEAWDKPRIKNLLQDSEMYMLDISFRDKHVGPAPHILTLTPINPGQLFNPVTPTSQLGVPTKPTPEPRTSEIKR